MQRNDEFYDIMHSYNEIQAKINEANRKILDEKEQQRNAVKVYMEAIKVFITNIRNNEADLSLTYQTFLTHLNDFEQNMYAEINDNNKPKWKDPVLTSKHLLETLKDTFDVTKTFAQKEKSINNFETVSRNATFTERTKRNIGGIVGFLVGVAALVAATYMTGGIILAIALTAPTLLVGVVSGLLGAKFGSCASKNQDDHRASHLSAELHTLNKERAQVYGCFFGQKTQKKQTAENPKQASFRAT